MTSRNQFGRTGLNFAACWLPAVALAILPGCAVFAYLVAEFSPAQKVEAVYELPENRRVLVFVDDYGNPDDNIAARDIKRRLTQKLNHELDQHEIVGSTVPYAKLVDVQSATPNFRSLRTEEVGQKVDADLVVYVHVDRFALRDPDSGRLWHGRLECRLKVLDVKQGMAGRGGRLWPQDADLYDVKAVDIPAESETSATYGEVLTRELIDQMAVRIGKVFREHKVESRDVTWEKVKEEDTR
ncbi:MAG: hypothetical protein ACOCVI_03360 [Planctomycetota bacterium]